MGRSCRARGFSLIELVIVVVIMGVVGAIAIPRISRGAAGAQMAALENDVGVLNRALEMYAAEHYNQYPTLSGVVAQLTGKTDEQGQPFGGVGIAYGPYLREVPALSTGLRKGQAGIAAVDGPTVGWLYSPAQGVIVPNLKGAAPETDVELIARVKTRTNLSDELLVLEP